MWTQKLRQAHGFLRRFECAQTFVLALGHEETLVFKAHTFVMLGCQAEKLAATEAVIQTLGRFAYFVGVRYSCHGNNKENELQHF